MEHLEKARAALDQGQLSPATAHLRTAIALDPGLSAAYHVLGEAQLRRSDHYEALLAYTRAFQASEADILSMMRAAEIHAFNAKWDACEPLARVVTERTGGNTAPLFIWALSLYKLNRLDEAETALQRVLQSDPKRLNAHYYLALCRRDRGDLEGALTSFSVVTRATDSHEQLGTNMIFPEAFFGETMLARRLGREPVSERARDFARRALADAQQAMQTHAHAAASRAFSQALALWPDYDEAASGAQACFESWAERILASDDDLASKHNAWVALLANQGDVAYRRALAEVPAYYAPARPASDDQPPEARPRLFDCFMFSEELDVLELRLNELEPYVDRFVLVESPWTHQGTPKPLVYAENKARFERFNHKIIHVIAGERIGKLTFHQDGYQRESIIDGLGDCRDDDIVLISDLDEIPRRDVVRAIANDWRLSGRPVVMSMVLRPYFINFESYEPWAKAVALPYGLVRRIGVNLSRYMMVRPPTTLIVKVLHDAGWHLTWMGGAESIIRKYRSYAHTEVSANAPSADEIRNAVTSGDIVRHAYRKGRWIDHTRSCPDTIRENPDHFRALGWIHGQPAG